MHRKFIAAAMLLAFAMVAMAVPALAQEKTTFKQFHTIVDYKFVAKYAKMPAPKGAMIVDSRPYKPKYVDGYIPTAVSIPA
ncbi:MAG TPA: sulfurtransferase, partial [Pseudodesulfovibrio sp.]|nr:sulfurtransferase [Pseudodesulfovibrio sp.]